jgi:hypothetical protein
MSPGDVRYFDLVREMKDTYNHWLRVPEIFSFPRRGRRAMGRFLRTAHALVKKKNPTPFPPLGCYGCYGTHGSPKSKM